MEFFELTPRMISHRPAAKAVPARDHTARRPRTTHKPDIDSTIQVYLREIGPVPLLTPADEVALAKRIRRGDAAARSQMILANLRLVVKIARDYEGLGLPLLDLISEGNIGLMKAVGRFDPRKGAKLSTYAAWWIKQSIHRALANQSRTIRLPVHVAATVGKMRRYTHRLTEQLGREPTDDELAKPLQLPAHKVARLRSIAVQPASLDAAVAGDDGDDGTQFGELIPDPGTPTPFEVLNSRTLRQELSRQLRHLDAREFAVLSLRYGLDGEDPQTLAEVGQRFHLSRERVRQLQEFAETKLRRQFTELDVPHPHQS